MFKEGPKDEGPPNVVDNGGGEEQQDEEDEEFEVFETLDDNPMKIVPGLYLGSFMAEQNLDKLKTEGITHVLCVANDLDASHPDEFKYLQIMISDRPTSDLVTHFPKCFAFIDEAIEQQGSVLVHCMAGVSRSASVVIGYIMNKRGMKYEEVFSLVREVRPWVRPNMGFENQLLEFEKLGNDPSKWKGWAPPLLQYKEDTIMNYFNSN
eukprot:gene1790-33210_t